MEEEIKIGEQEPEKQIDPSTGEIIENPQVDDFTDSSIPHVEGSENSQIIEEVKNDIPLIEEVEDDTPKVLVTIKKSEEVAEQKPVAKIDESKNEEKKEEEIGDIFVNYDSDFHKNQRTILQKIRAFKMTPKTSITFVLLLIVITVGGIGIMMKIDPKNHNLDNYKANILALMGKEVPVKTTGITNNNSGAISSNTGITDTGSQDITGSGTINTGSGETSSGSIDDKEEILIREKWLTISPDIITNQDGSISYLYKGKVYTKEELQEQLRLEVKIEINRKTKDYLNKVYIH